MCIARDGANGGSVVAKPPQGIDFTNLTTDWNTILIQFYNCCLLVSFVGTVKSHFFSHPLLVKFVHLVVIDTYTSLIAFLAVSPHFATRNRQNWLLLCDAHLA